MSSATRCAVSSVTAMSSSGPMTSVESTPGSPRTRSSPVSTSKTAVSSTLRSSSAPRERDPGLVGSRARGEHLVDAPTRHAHRLADGFARRGIERHEPPLERDERQPPQAAGDQVELLGQPRDAIGEDLPGSGVLESISDALVPPFHDARAEEHQAVGLRAGRRIGIEVPQLGRGRLPRASRRRTHRRGRGHPPRRFLRRRREIRRRSRRCASASRSC